MTKTRKDFVLNYHTSARQTSSDRFSMVGGELSSEIFFYKVLLVLMNLVQGYNTMCESFSHIKYSHKVKNLQYMAKSILSQDHIINHYFTIYTIGMHVQENS